MRDMLGLLEQHVQEAIQFYLNMFHHFKDHFFKVLATNIITDGLPLMFNQDGEPCFLFSW